MADSTTTTPQPDSPVFDWAFYYHVKNVTEALEREVARVWLTDVEHARLIGCREQLRKLEEQRPRP